MFKPMLAGVLTKPEELKFPVLVSPKLDGIRCVTRGNQVLSRKLKDIPNHFIRQEILKETHGFDLDGELMVDGDFNNVQSAVMREEGEPDFRYFVFDIINNEMQALDRLSILKHNYDTKLLNVVGANGDSPKHRIMFLQHNIAHSVEDLNRYEEECIKQGYEGVMIRGMQSPYKYGRSTEKEGYLLKMKRFSDAEGIVTGFVERMHNGNEATKDALGNTKRSSSAAGKVPTGTLGALIVESNDHGSFQIGTGFCDEQRLTIWNEKSKYLGAVVTYKYQELSIYGIPRFPVFQHLRMD